MSRAADTVGGGGGGGGGGDRTEYDLIVVGGGTAGLVAAAGAAGIGAPRVALAERARLGGECLWTGCVPSKALIACARALHRVREASRFGVQVGGASVDPAGVWQWVRSAQATIAPHDSAERFRSLGVEIVAGEAHFVGDRVLEVDGRSMRAKRVLIATGSRPAVPPVDGISDGKFLTNENLFELTTVPESLIIVGAGAVGLEMAQAFARLGSRVLVVEAADRALAREDTELADILLRQLRAEGIEVLVGATATSVTYGQRGNAGGATPVTLAIRRSDGERESRSADALLVATGRKPNVEALQLDRASVRTDRNGIAVSPTLRTSTSGVWAAGDVTGSPRFTHVADYEARLVVRNAFFPFAREADYRVVPWVTFTDPPLAHLGLTESEAREQHGGSVTVWRRTLNHLDRAIADGNTTGLVKIIAGHGGRILGAHILGNAADSMIGELALAMRARLSLSDVANTIHAYPTYPDAIRQAANEYQKSRLTGLARQVAGWFARH